MCMATPQLRLVVTIVKAGRKSAVFSGIVPDQRHLGSGGYHVCLVHLASHKKLGDYSSTRPLDKTPKVTAAGKGYSCACDISMSPADMKRSYASVKKVYGDRSDPRRRWVNAINCWSGSGDAKRFNFQQNTVGYASPDHKSHVHADLPRAYVDQARSKADADKAARAAASIIVGESKASWIAREETPAVKPAGKAKAIVHTVVAGDTLYAIAKAAGITVATLQAWNGLKTADIFPRQVLRLTAPPAKPKPAPARPPVKVPTWPVGARSFFRPRAGAPHYATVDLWQAAMRAHGWTITADGFLGPKSGIVLVAFQRAEGLKVTKVLDKPTFIRAFTTAKRGK